MSFREKSAWITFVLLIGFGAYFGELAREWLTPGEPHINHLRLFLALIIAIVVLEVVTHVSSCAVVSWSGPGLKTRHPTFP